MAETQIWVYNIGIAVKAESEEEANRIASAAVGAVEEFDFQGEPVLEQHGTVEERLF